MGSTASTGATARSQAGASPASGWSRRRFLAAGGATGAGFVLAGCVPPGRRPGRRPRPEVPALPGDPFTLGVASGDPTPTSVILWTRLAPAPLEGGGMPEVDVPVTWEVARDESMRAVIARGTALARPEAAHSVRVDVRGLLPNRWFWYRFRVGDWTSRVGRTRTTPVVGHHGTELAFAFASCQKWESGFYTAYRHMAEEDLDLVVHLGDYIYEGNIAATDQPRGIDRTRCFTLDQYRDRYAIYRTDPDLQAAHAAFPWVCTWDDHEVANDYADDFDPGSDATPEEFLARRAAAYQAYWEHLPLRVAPPVGPDFPIHRRVNFGRLATFHVLDTRQFRSRPACPPFLVDGTAPQCDASFAPDHTILGADQKAWLLDGLDRTRARWNILAQQIPMAEASLLPGADPKIVIDDKWDGFPRARREILDHVAARPELNAVVISGDLHSSGVSDLRPDYDDPASPTVATEFLGTSISSTFPDQFLGVIDEVIANNPHIRWYEPRERGYVRCTVSRDAYRADYRHLETALAPDGAIRTVSSWLVEPGRPGPVATGPGT